MASGFKGAPGALTTEVGKIIKGELAYRGEDQKDLAEATGISASMLSAMLNGQKHITLSDLDKICFALRESVLELLKKAEAKTSGRHAEGDWGAARL
ncbi:MAG: helix-turn-helix transcriptional regulator [Actinomycetales bacterium]|nr:helix-turn-helix transcriptional regulator [Actinomycetales bacterium]